MGFYDMLNQLLCENHLIVKDCKLFSKKFSTEYVLICICKVFHNRFILFRFVIELENKFRYLPFLIFKFYSQDKNFEFCQISYF